MDIKGIMNHTWVYAHNHSAQQLMPNTPAPTTNANTDDILDVLIVGAGLSGIGAARHLQKQLPHKTWKILESRANLGGTWDLFRYPGVRSDSDMHTLGYNFKPWAERQAIADGQSILKYIQETADETGITQRIDYGCKVSQAQWSSPEACWTITYVRQPGDPTHTLKARFLYLCSGYYRYDRAHQPHFEGEELFEGVKVHPQFWPRDLDYSGKQVVVIGSGATAATLVPEMAKTAAHVTMLQRSPTYMVTRPAEDRLAIALNRYLPSTWAYALTRWKNVLLGMFFYKLSRNRPQAIKRYLVDMARRQLPRDFDLRHFTPQYKPWDQRVCALPNGDLFTQLRQGRVSVVTDTVKSFTPHGLLLSSGQSLNADVVVTATGLELSVLGGIEWSVDGKPYGPADALAYKGMMLSNLPNAFMALGYTNASWTLKADLTAHYVCRLLLHMDRHGQTRAEPIPNGPVNPQSFFDLNSGYVQRSAILLPKQGDQQPWKVYQNYFKDWLNLRWSRLDDGVMRFS